MQRIVFEEPYEFIPPYRGRIWPFVIQSLKLYKRYLRKSEGIVEYECRHEERLKASLDAGHGIMLTPNHSRPGDPMVLGDLAGRVGTYIFAMASWHLFKQSWFDAYAIRRMGGFSLYREGMDRQSINTAIDIVANAQRPLIVFPEGSVTRTNDRVQAMLDGVSFIARTAAKRRQKLGAEKKVVVHPIALKYLFQDELLPAVTPVLSEMELRLTWQPNDDMPLLARIEKLGRALLSLKEIEYFGAAQEGRVRDRLKGLIDRLLVPLEEEWFGGGKEGPVVPRVKNLRSAILPEMVKGKVDDAERTRRWRQLADVYLAQQVSCYSADYLVERPSEMRILETVQRMEEDLNDVAKPHGDMKVVIEVGEAIEVSPVRNRDAEVDPLMAQISTDLQTMLDRLSLESPIYEESP